MIAPQMMGYGLFLSFIDMWKRLSYALQDLLLERLMHGLQHVVFYCPHFSPGKFLICKHHEFYMIFHMPLSITHMYSSIGACRCQYVVVPNENVQAKSFVSSTLSYWYHKLPTMPIPDSFQELISLSHPKICWSYWTR